MASLVVGKGGSDLGPLSSSDEYIFVYCKWKNSACNEVFKGGSIGKTICQPFCKNSCLASLPSLLFSLVRLDSIRL